MKYEFKIISTDNYELVYIDRKKEEKSLKFTKDVALTKKLQELQMKGRLKLQKMLKEMGMTKGDLIERKEIDGKIIYDDHLYREYEEEATGLVSIEVLDDIFGIKFNMTLTELLEDMGINAESTSVKDTEQVQLFLTKFITIITRGENNEEAPSK